MMYLRQEVSMRQDMVQTPQQILRSELLQLPIMLLEARLKLEVEENPVLEFAEEEAPVEELGEPGHEDEEDREEAPADLDPGEAIDDEENWNEFINEDNLTPYGRDTGAVAGQELMDIPRPQVLTLQERLAEQLQMDSALDYEDQRIGLEIIGNMGDSGYLECGADYLALLLEQPEERVERVIKRIQHYDPVGICARDLRECLLVQLEVLAEGGQSNEVAVRILRDHYEDFADKRFEILARQLEVSLDAVREAFAYISRLNPRPGQGEQKDKENYIIPDLVVERIEHESEDGTTEEEFLVSLVDGSLPTVRISRTYEEMIRSRRKMDKSVREFVQRKVESARWFLSAIQQRRETMLRVMRSIIKLQIDFFRFGKEHIRPLILRDVAEDIEMDISTISRVTNRKYVQTEWGVFELRYFFSERLSTDSGEDVSTKIIKDRLHAIIEGEDKRKPLSDQAIANLLKKEGYHVARRTVQKYREQLRIPVKRLRREI
jgi:RNA polymerase sigma-54 factor